jgi:hypothetical protein
LHKYCRAHVIVEEWNGKERNKISKFLLEDTVKAAPAVAPPAAAPTPQPASTGPRAATRW